MIDAPEKIGARLKALRKYIGVSQPKLAEMINVAQPQWSQYESGSRRLTIDVAGILVERFGVTLDWLYLGNSSGLPMRLQDLANAPHEPAVIGRVKRSILEM